MCESESECAGYKHVSVWVQVYECAGVSVCVYAKQCMAYTYGHTRMATASGKRSGGEWGGRGMGESSRLAFMSGDVVSGELPLSERAPRRGELAADVS